jgi:hypothetical protein
MRITEFNVISIAPFAQRGVAGGPSRVARRLWLRSLQTIFASSARQSAVLKAEKQKNKCSHKLIFMQYFKHSSKKS